MATARAKMYALTSKKVEKEPTGQAARLLKELRANTDPRLAEDIDLAIATSDEPYKTRQDSLRITLYYLIIFRKRGLVVATDQPVPEDAPADVDAEVEDVEVEDETEEVPAE